MVKAAQAATTAPTVAATLARIADLVPPAGGGPVLIRLKGGRVIDPAHGRDAVGDVFIDDGRIVAAPAAGRAPGRDL